LSEFDPRKFFSNDRAPPAPRHLGWRLIDFDLERGWIKLGFEPKKEFLNLSGNVQGGFITAMLDDTVGPAVVLKTRGTKGISTIDLHAHFLRPLPLGDVIAEGEVTRLGKSIAFTEGKLFDAQGNLCARATSSAMLVDIAAKTHA
jgi:uncharacterized protein (TIGR00369 family)